MKRATLGVAFRDALIVMSAVLPSFAIVFALGTHYGTGPSPAVLSAALAVGLARRADRLTLRAWLLRFLGMPAVALVAAAIGLLLLKIPPAGAALFCIGIAVSIWLRNFGKPGAAAGRTIALPLIAILVVPVRVSAASPEIAPALLIAAGAIAFLCTTAVTLIASRLGLTSAAPPARERLRERRAGTLPIATRMALQMLAALALAFAAGMTLFHARWPWLVLTAFIVCSGTVARGDAVYKSVLRLAGALSGTLLALVVALVPLPNPGAYAACIFFVLFLGLWLRRISYAYWAACATLLFALLQKTGETVPVTVFALRVAGIAAGAACAIAATWFVFPIRTEQFVRRKVADALAALRDTLAGQAGRESLEFHVSELHRVAPPARWHRTLFRIDDEQHPATLIDRAHDLLSQAQTEHFDRSAVGTELRRLGALLRKET